VKRTVVIGCSGSGKSVFSRKLCDATGLSLYYLDMIWHKPDGTNISREEFDKQLDSIISRDSWIIDGNYQRTLETRIKACDTVFLFDLPTEICIEGALSRIGKKREDMPWFENELDPEFRQWIESFRANQLPEVYRLLEKYKNNREIVVFRTREQADKFIEKLV
jgi:adenylate kinase family enzyme